MTTRVAKTVSISLQVPGAVPETVKLKVGQTVADLKKDRNIESGYVVSVNGEEVKDNYVFAKGDIVRIGVKTKNA